MKWQKLHAALWRKLPPAQRCLRKILRQGMQSNPWWHVLTPREQDGLLYARGTHAHHQAALEEFLAIGGPLAHARWYRQLAESGEYEIASEVLAPGDALLGQLKFTQLEGHVTSLVLPTLHLGDLLMFQR